MLDGRGGPQRTPAQLRAIKKQGVAWASAGLGLALAVALVLRLLGAAQFQLATWLVAVGITTIVQTVLWLIPHMGWDARLSWDRRYVVMPMLAAAALLAFYVYLAPQGRHLLLIGWFVALLFLAGIAGFTEIVSLGLVMALFYMGAVGSRYRKATPSTWPSSSSTRSSSWRFTSTPASSFGGSVISVWRCGSYGRSSRRRRSRTASPGCRTAATSRSISRRS
jgi:hypothetical protein